MKDKLLILLCFTASSCNSIIITHTQGSAADVVDSQPTVETTGNPTVSVPLTAPAL